MSPQAFFLTLGMRLWVKPRLRRTETVDQFRALFDRLVAWAPDAPRSATIRPDRVGGVPGEWVTAAGVPAAGGVLLYLHGGAYCWGRPSYYRRLTWRLSAACAVPVFAADYRLAPEHPFPAAVEDATAAYRGLLQGGHEPERIAVAGDSAGGGLTFAALVALRDAGERMPAAAAALCPWTDLAGTGESVAANARADPMFPPEGAGISRAAAVYLNGADPTTPLASPLYADLRGLPPTLIQVGSTEILLDDSRRMAARLADAGVPVELDVWPDMPHVWQMMADYVPESRRAVDRIGAFVRRHLGRAP